jgi:hypothetical protein
MKSGRRSVHSSMKYKGQEKETYCPSTVQIRIVFIELVGIL